MKPEHLKILEDGAATIGLRLDAEQRALLARHVDVLLKWNKSVNLTAITDPIEVVEKHLLDSLALAPLVPKGTLLDAGPGGRFPRHPRISCCSRSWPTSFRSRRPNVASQSTSGFERRNRRVPRGTRSAFARGRSPVVRREHSGSAVAMRGSDGEGGLGVGSRD